MAEVDELRPGTGAEEGIELGTPEPADIEVVAGAEADEDFDDIRQEAEGDLREGAEPLGAPVVVPLADVVGGEFVGEIEMGERAGERKGDGLAGGLVEVFLEGGDFLRAEGALVRVEEVAVVGGDFSALRSHADVVAVCGEEEQGEFVVGEISPDGAGEEILHAVGDSEGVPGIVQGEVERGSAAFLEDGIELPHPLLHGGE